MNVLLQSLARVLLPFPLPFPLPKHTHTHAHTHAHNSRWLRRTDSSAYPPPPSPSPSLLTLTLDVDVPFSFSPTPPPNPVSPTMPSHLTQQYNGTQRKYSPTPFLPYHILPFHSPQYPFRPLLPPERSLHNTPFPSNAQLPKMPVTILRIGIIARWFAVLWRKPPPPHLTPHTPIPKTQRGLSNGDEETPIHTRTHNTKRDRQYSCLQCTCVRATRFAGGVGEKGGEEERKSA